MSRVLRFFKPHKSVPEVPWTATSLWALSPTRVLILLVSLFVFGLGDSLLIASGLGNAPWSVLGQGLARQLDVSIGTATLMVSLFVLLMWIPLKEKPGFGTVMNILLIALAIDLGLAIYPEQDSLLMQLLYVFAGIALVGVGSAFYITTGLGPGPRDGWMTSLHRRTGVPIGRVRLAIETTVLVIGWLLGGAVGIGTALFALLIGSSVAISFGVVDRLTAK